MEYPARDGRRNFAVSLIFLTEESVDRTAMKIATWFSRFSHVLGDAPAIAVHIAIAIWHHNIMVAWLSW